jgi:hypothetical protein
MARHDEIESLRDQIRDQVDVMRQAEALEPVGSGNRRTLEQARRALSAAASGLSEEREGLQRAQVQLAKFAELIETARPDMLATWDEIADEQNHLAGYITGAVTRALEEDDPAWSLIGVSPRGFRLRGERATYVVTIVPELDEDQATAEAGE